MKFAWLSSLTSKLTTQAGWGLLFFAVALFLVAGSGEH
jgi:hypothetical protein